MAGTAFDPDDKVELSLDSFLSQHVICLLGEWVSRRAVIKFIANIAHGVHSGTPKGDTERDDAILAKARSSVNYAQKDGGFHFSLHLDQIHGTPPPLAYDPKSIDPVLFELLSTAYFLATSADVLALENIIRQEVGV